MGQDLVSFVESLMLIDSNGYIYAVDTENSRIQMWSPGSSTGVTVAGVTGKIYNFHNIYVCIYRFIG